ncbi:pyridoxamine 5'-phosphate oxidase family protein [Streptomyces sp. NPDC052301]|uniref:pyridoxamine 5'-phosphate oxidase family protein n=1 Tax=Streptomyces sp. NPDC052301 TaxID=3365687 RepID=UPI0037D7F51C
MRAHLGDQLVIESPATGGARRDGEIVGLRHEDGTPPYDVRWSDTDEVTLVFPGPDAHVHHLEHGAPVAAPQTPPDTQETASGSTAPRPAGAGNPGDVGRRVAAERRRRGLSREETAGRARMSPGYLAHLEESPADPNSATLVRLADALGTTVAALRGGGMDLPPGQGHALLHPRFRDLDPEECRSLLSTHGVGRIAVSASEGSPVVVPVNYEVVDDAIVFRTAPDSVAAGAAEREIAFEVDHVDEALSQGWSVLAVGPASVVTDPEAVRRLARHAHSTPWAGGEREMWVAIRPTILTGRRITPSDQ